MSFRFLRLISKTEIGTWDDFPLNTRQYLTGVLEMSYTFQLLKNLLRDEEGPTAVEYAVLLALIIAVCLAAITLLGQNTNATFNTVATSIGGP